MDGENRVKHFRACGGGDIPQAEGETVLEDDSDRRKGTVENAECGVRNAVGL